MASMTLACAILAIATAARVAACVVVVCFAYIESRIRMQHRALSTMHIRTHTQQLQSSAVCTLTFAFTWHVVSAHF